MQSEAKPRVRKRYLHIDQYWREYQGQGLAFLGLGISGIRPSFRISKPKCHPPPKQLERSDQSPHTDPRRYVLT